MSVRRFLRDSRGGAAVEAALCLPVLTVMIMGAFWFGWTQHQASTMRYALHGASRALVLNPDLTQQQLTDMVKAQIKGGESSLVNVSLATSTTTSGRQATLTATYTTNLSIPLAGTHPISQTAVVKSFLPYT